MSEDEDIAGSADPHRFEKFVVVSGCSGGGKSSLLSEMARRGYDTKPEPGRQIVKEQIGIDGDGVPWRNAERFTELCLSRAILVHTSADASGGHVLFDRSVVDNVTASARFGLPLPSHLRNAVYDYRYAPVVFLTPPWEELFENDHERRHTFSDAVAEYEALLKSYPAAGYAVTLIPQASISERADFFERQLANSAV